MTKKDFNELAAILKRSKDRGEDMPCLLFGELVQFCRDQNPRFDAHRFLVASGYGEDE